MANNETSNHDAQPEIDQITAAPTSESTPFFRLPGELRNKIYRYVLTSPEPLYCNLFIMDDLDRAKGITVGSFFFTDHLLGYEEDKEPSELVFNKLKYVNRKLHRETKGLELIYNTISFGHFDIIRAVNSLFHFTATVTPTKLSWISTVVIRSDDRCPSHVTESGVLTECIGLPMLAMFCKQNPHINVHYVLRRFAYRECDLKPNLDELWRAIYYMSMGMTLWLGLGNDETIFDIWLPSSKTTGYIVRLANDWKKRQHLEQLLEGVRNFSIFPGETSIDSWFVETTHFLAEQAAEEEKCWLEWANRWIEHGITPAF